MKIDYNNNSNSNSIKGVIIHHNNIKSKDTSCFIVNGGCNVSINDIYFTTHLDIKGKKKLSLLHKLNKLEELLND